MASLAQRVTRRLRRAPDTGNADGTKPTRDEAQLSVADQRELACLRDRERRIDDRLAAIDGEIARARPGTYEAQELGIERNDLHAYARITANKIADILALAKKDERRTAMVNVNVSARERALRASIERNRATGDHRQSRLERMQLLDLRRDVERELGGGLR